MKDYRPKWIDEIESMPGVMDMSPASWEDIQEVLLRINTLLCIAGSETDNEFLHEDIEKETQNVQPNVC